MVILEYMTELNRKYKMSFDLNIDFNGIEIKSGAISIKTFLGLSTQIGNLIESLCIYKTHVNFAETILSGLTIFGEIDYVFNHKSFSNALIEFQKEFKTSWVGHFTYEDSKNKFIFHAPDFVLLEP